MVSACRLVCGEMERVEWLFDLTEAGRKPGVATKGVSYRSICRTDIRQDRR